MSAVAEEVALRWLKPDDYHIRSECNRYTVCRMSVGACDHYVAWRLNGDSPATELGSLLVRLSAPESVRLDAIHAMQQRCVDHSQGAFP